MTVELKVCGACSSLGNNVGDAKPSDSADAVDIGREEKLSLFDGHSEDGARSLKNG